MCVVQSEVHASVGAAVSDPCAECGQAVHSEQGLSAHSMHINHAAVSLVEVRVASSWGLTLHAACHRAGSQSLQQLHYAITDLALHTSYAPGPGTSVQTSHVFRDVTANTTVIAPVEEDRRAPCICGQRYATEWEAPCMFPPT